MKHFVSPAIALVLTIVLAAPASANCQPEDFAAAVDEAGQTLRNYNASALPKIQAKVDDLTARKGWKGANAQEKAFQHIQDNKISSLDSKANDLLVKIDKLGRPPEQGAADCTKLDDLKASGLELLAVMKTKTAYTLNKLDQELGKSGAKPPAKKAAVKKTAAAMPADTPATTKQNPTSKNQEIKTAKTPKSEKEQPTREPPTASWSTTTTATLEPDADTALRSPQDLALNDADNYGAPYGVPPDGVPLDEGYTVDEIRDATRGFFGTISTNLGSVIEHTFKKWGRPTAYVLGQEGGGAFLAGLRYGSGMLYLHRGDRSKVYWHGPSVGYDFGAAGSRTLFLIYKLDTTEQLFRSYTGVDGSAYLVGGVGVTLLKGGPVIMAPIRSGLGLRIGANIGYIRFTPQATWNPF